MYYSVIQPEDMEKPDEGFVRRKFMGSELLCDKLGRIRQVQSTDPAVYLQLLLRYPCSCLSRDDPAGPECGQR